MEVFPYRTSFRVHRAIQCSWPLLILGGAFAYASILADMPGGAFGYLSQGWMPVILVGSLVWLILELVWTVQTFQFSVGLSDNSIRVGKVTVPWSDIVGTEFKTAIGKASAIVLTTRSAGDLAVPAAIEGLDYISGVVKRRTNTDTTARSSQPDNPEQDKRDD